MADSAAVKQPPSSAAVPQGRPKIELNVDQVYALARVGISRAVMADFFGVSRSTLQRRLDEEGYGDAYRGGKAEMIVNIASKMEKLANDGVVPVLLKMADHHLGMGNKPAQVDIEIETEGSSIVRLHWTDDMDAGFDEFLANEKEHPTIDVTPVESKDANEEPQGDAAIPEEDVP